MPKVDQDALTRSISGLVFVVLMVFGVLWSAWSQDLLFTTIVFTALFEYARMTKCAIPWSIGLLGGLLFLGQHLLPPIALSSLWWTLFAIATAIPTGQGSYFRDLTLRIMGLALVAVSFSLLDNLLIAEADRWGILSFFIILWINDTMAYVTGRTFGKNKLWPRISPGKTWEGLIGGLLFAGATAYLLSLWAGPSGIHTITAGVIIGLFGTLGDLSASALKRNAGVKDTGHFMPGHGGMLDRFDGVTLAAPAIFCYLVLFS